MKTTFGELAKDIGKVTPVASALNLKTEELFTSLAVTTAQGLATSESISGLKAAMSNIIKPSKEASEAAESLGIDFSVSALQSKGWINFLNDAKLGLQNASPEFDNISVKFGENSMKLLELEKAGQKTSKEYKNLVKENKALNKELELLSQAADSPIGGMATLFGSVEGLNAMLMLTSEQGMAKYTETITEMSTNTSALSDAYGKMSDTTEFKFKKAMNQSKNAVMELGARLLPTINKAIDLFSGLIDKFNELDPSVQDSILSFTMFTAVIGPVLSGIGKMTSGIGGLVKTGIKVVGFFSKFSTGASAVATATNAVGTSAAVAGGASGMGALLGSIGSFATAALPWVAAAGAVAAGGYAIYKTLDQEVIPAVDLFEDKISYSTEAMNGYATQFQSDLITISDATKEAVGAYMEMSDGVTEALTGMYYSSQVVTDETANSLITKYTEMGQMVTNQIETDKNNDINILTEFFSKTTTLTEEEKAETLRLTQEGYENKRITIEETQNRIIEILTNAKNEARELKEKEVMEISELQNQLRTNAITILSEQEAEANVILDRMAAYDNRVTAEQAGKHIQTFNEQRDKVIDSANSEYREVVSTIENMRDKLGAISAEQADELIREAERQRDDTIQAAKDTRDEAVDKIFTMNKELVDDVDSSTGEIVSFWDKLFGKWDRWTPGKKSLQIETNHTKYERTVRETYNKPTSGMSMYNNALEAISRGVELYKNNNVSDISEVVPITNSNIELKPYSRYKLSGGYYNPLTSSVSNNSNIYNTGETKNNNKRESIVENYDIKFIIEKFEGRSEEELKKLVEFFDSKLRELKNNKNKLRGVTSLA